MPLIACGGSIESRTTADGTKVVDGDMRVAARAAAAAVGCSVRVHRFARRPSFALDTSTLVDLAGLVVKVGARRRAVVTCGTDLMEEAAFVLDLLAPPPGVVLTGAAGDASPGSDAEANLVGGLHAARSRQLAGGCAYLAFAGAIRLGRSVVETAGGQDLFRDSPGPPLGRWDELGPRVSGRPVRPLPAVDVPSRLARVLLVEAHAGCDGSFLDLDGADVVVLHGFGAGNAPPTLATALERRLAKGGPVVVCSTVPAVPVRRISAELGGGGRLLAAGAVSAGALTARKAAVLAALCFGDDRPDGAQTFATVVSAVGEARGR